MKKCIPNRELDELGEGLVRSFLKKSRIGRLPKCVDIEGLANSLGLTVIFEEFAEDDFDKIGFLADGNTPLKIRKSGKIVSFLFPLGTIVVDSRLRRECESGKCRFTIAHEVSHHVIGRHDPAAQYQRNVDAERCYTLEEMSRQFNLEEMQADKLAAAILMPGFIVRAALKDFNNGNKLRVYGDQVLAPQERIAMNKMAAQIGVSYTALIIRMRQFDLLEYRPLEEYIEKQLLAEVAYDDINEL